MFVFILFLIAALPCPVTAHGGIWNYSIAGEWRPGYPFPLPTTPNISSSLPLPTIPPLLTTP